MKKTLTEVLNDYLIEALLERSDEEVLSAISKDSKFSDSELLDTKNLIQETIANDREQMFNDIENNFKSKFSTKNKNIFSMYKEIINTVQRDSFSIKLCTALDTIKDNDSGAEIINLWETFDRLELLKKSASL